MEIASPRPSYRARPPPPPIRVPASASGSRPTTPTALAGFSPENLLYDLPPSAGLRSPPPPPPSAGARSLARSRSPPSTSARRTSFGAILQNSGGQDVFSPVPSPKRHAASLGGNEPTQRDLDSFAEACRRWYYEQNQLAGKQMQHALNEVDPSHRATYTRVQAAIRSAYHADQTLRKIMEFRALVSSINPGQSLTPAARSQPGAPLAKKERLEKLQHLVQTYCLSEMPGTHPFFAGLYGILRLQALPEKLGGAGDRIIEWEIDDAVFLESAGKDFTSEALTVLKGVLGFEESPGDFAGSLLDPDAVFDPNSDDEDEVAFQPTASSTRLRQISPSTSTSVPLSTPSAASSSNANRARMNSDPFLDPSRSQAHLATTPTSPTANPMDFDSATLAESESLTPSHSHSQSVPHYRSKGALAAAAASSKRVSRIANPTAKASAFSSDAHYRIWVFPKVISNPEVHALCAMFPTFITKRAVARFPVAGASSSSSSRRKEPLLTPGELEAGIGAGPEIGMRPTGGADVLSPGEIRVGTGKMRLSEHRRNEGWRGSFWERMREWFRNLFG